MPSCFMHDWSDLATPFHVRPIMSAVISKIHYSNPCIRDGPLFFWRGGGGGGMKNIEKNCLQGLKRQNKLFANIICIKKNSLHRSQKLFF